MASRPAPSSPPPLRNIPVPMPNGVVPLADCIWSVEKLLAFPVGQ
jgi:hypothetical protein